MAELVGVYAASHTPVMVNFPDQVSKDDSSAVYEAFKALGRRIAAARPDVVITVSDDHLHNFFLDNMPAFVIGTSDQYPTPIEEWLKIEKRVLQGDTELGAYLLHEAFRADFDPAFSMQMILDHGMVTPLELAGIAGDTPIVPITINCVQPPLPSMRRCIQFGRAIGEAIRRYDSDKRVAVLATGGLSHDVGTPRMGMLNEDFDLGFLKRLGEGDDEALWRYSEERVNEAGNGAEEVRNWLFAYGAAAGAPYQHHFYRGVTDWYTGIALGEWRLQGNG